MTDQWRDADREWHSWRDTAWQPTSRWLSALGADSETQSSDWSTAAQPSWSQSPSAAADATVPKNTDAPSQRSSVQDAVTQTHSSAQDASTQSAQTHSQDQDATQRVWRSPSPAGRALSSTVSDLMHHQHRLSVPQRNPGPARKNPTQILQAACGRLHAVILQEAGDHVPHVSDHFNTHTDGDDLAILPNKDTTSPSQSHTHHPDSSIQPVPYTMPRLRAASRRLCTTAPNVNGTQCFLADPAFTTCLSRHSFCYFTNIRAPPRPSYHLPCSCLRLIKRQTERKEDECGREGPMDRQTQTDMHHRVQDLEVQ